MFVKETAVLQLPRAILDWQARHPAITWIFWLIVWAMVAYWVVWPHV